MHSRKYQKRGRTKADPRSSRGGRRARRNRGRGVTAAWLAVGAICLAGVAFVVTDGGGADGVADSPRRGDQADDIPSGTASPDGDGSGDEAGPDTATPEATLPEASMPPSTGRFVTADASGDVVGTGSTVRRYQVQVETGIGLSPEEVAAEVEEILADPRGWTANGQDSFQLVSDGSYDFQVKVATPDTVDRICGEAGLDTHGEVNCAVGDQAMVNLKRWTTGSPQFPGPLHEYRALIINHEVGHRIGHGHEGCPGPGQPAPAMMQQIDGLDGCTANAWPYDSEGNYLSGPPLP